MTPQPISLLDDNYGWALPVGDTGALVVDPSEPLGVQKFLRARGRTLLGVLVTHHHGDHIGGIRALVSAADRPLPVVASFHDMAQDLVPGANIAAEPGKLLKLAGQTFDVLHVPGHTHGSVAYLWREGGAVFTGDTLFAGGCGRMFEGNAAQMWASLVALRALPCATLVCCGHEYTHKNLQFAAHFEPDHPMVAKRLEEVAALRQRGLPTVPVMLKEERLTNPFLRADEPALMAKLGCCDPPAAFAELRRRKDRF